MEHRVVWVHGIGPHSPGYSVEWQSNFNRYLNLASQNYLEVCWDTVFKASQGATRSAEGGPAIALTTQEQLAAEDVRQDLETMLQARASALQQESMSATRGSDDGSVVEYDEFRAGPGTTRGSLDWLFKPDEYIGDFVKYLVSRNVRNAIKEKAKEILRPLAGSDTAISVVAHSWGTVVSYDALLDLEVEVPQLRVANLITLGSPLWMVRRMLEDRSGRKPGQITNWVNVHARGDVVGSWLQPAFKDDKDFAVPSFGSGGAHSSYFVPNNQVVQQDIIAKYILG